MESKRGLRIAISLNPEKLLSSKSQTGNHKTVPKWRMKEYQVSIRTVKQI